ncbi:NAD(+) diphosphatase [Rhodovulum sulfidophilum]|uniref:NAD(+) diphosphatase n=1 Tax=Rhodovulum sulfidophilum TaxID=35806 RepID=UPI001389A3C0|nr:NAD(+) diphosphatase [Rhodovulum sulfidophilum]NDK35660.1 NAD(+) diphosphatase [Rhodovulum sulfidophilum]
MRLAERVTFGGGGLDRAAHRRGDAAWLAEAWAGAQVLPLWRGKPLFGAEGLGWVASAHPLLAGRSAEAVFLGLSGGRPKFAIELSDWVPAEMPETLGQFRDPSEQRHPELPGDLSFRELRREMTRLLPVEAELAATAKGLFDWHRGHGFCARCGQPSRPAEAGWQRRCPGCGAPHFPRTDPVVIMLVRRGNAVLLGRAPGWAEGMFSLLAGFVEPGETVEAAVRREVAEETGVRVGQVGYLASQPWPFPASLMLGCWAEAETDRITPDPAEIEEARWVGREDMLAVLAGERTDMQPPRPGAIAGFLIRMWLADRLD